MGLNQASCVTTPRTSARGVVKAPSYPDTGTRGMTTTEEQHSYLLPKYLFYQVLVCVVRYGRKDASLGPKGRATLCLLFLALEALGTLGETRWSQGVPDLPKVARALKDGRGRLGTALRRALEKHLDLLLPFVPEEIGRLPKTKRASALRRYLAQEVGGYKAWDLWRELLRGINDALPDLGKPLPDSRGCVCLPLVPEAILALLPFPVLGVAFFQALANSWRFQNERLQEATAAHFVYGFVRQEERFPFNKGAADLFRDIKPLRKEGDMDWAYLDCDAKGTVLEAKRKDANTLCLSAYLEEDTRLKGTRLRKHLKMWYEFADVLAAHYLRCGGSLHPGNGGYDWDLIEEYHEAILRWLRDGRCPFKGDLEGEGVRR